MFARLTARRPHARFAVSRFALAALLALSVVAGHRPAAAQSGMQPSPASLLIAKQIIDLKGVKDVFQPLLRGVVEKSKNMFMQTNFMWGKDLNEVAAMVEKQYEPRLNELVDSTARIYASHFTEQELKDLLTFYQSPLGRKMTVEEPKALDESMANAGRWGDALSQEVIASMRAEMKKRGHDM